MPRQKGFSLIDCMVLVGIVLVICAVAMPMFKNARDTIRLQEAAKNYADIVQRARLEAANGNTYHAVGIQYLSSSNVIAYIDTADTNNPPSLYSAPEPMAALGSEVIFSQAGAPAISDLSNKVSNGGTLAYPPVFGAQGLPCMPVPAHGGKACDAQWPGAYATYFQSGLGKWEAVTVNPAGQVQIWSYDPSVSVWNQV